MALKLPHPIYLRCSEYARLRGYATRTVRRMAAAEQLPVLRLGNQRRIDLQELGLATWPALDHLLTLEDLATLLNVSGEFLVHLEGFPMFKAEGRWLCLRRELTRWLAEHTVGAGGAG